MTESAGTLAISGQSQGCDAFTARCGWRDGAWQGPDRVWLAGWLVLERNIHALAQLVSGLWQLITPCPVLSGA